MRLSLFLRLRFLEFRLYLAEVELFDLVERVLPYAEGDGRLTTQVLGDIQRVHRKIADLELRIHITEKMLRRLARAV